MATNDGQAGAGPREVSTGEGPAVAGRAAVAQDVQGLRARGQALARAVVYDQGVPVGVELVVTDDVRAPASGVRGVAGVRTADASAPDPVYAPGRLTEAQMVALIGADGVARARAAEGLGVGAVAAAAPDAAAVSGPPDVAGFSAAASGTGRVDGGKRAVRVRKGTGGGVRPDPDAVTITERMSADGPVPIPASDPGGDDGLGDRVAMVFAADDDPLADLNAATADAIADAPVFDIERAAAAPLEPVFVEAPLDPPAPHQRAASDTDTPSRGLPTVSTDGASITTSGLPITGGFAEEGTVVGEAAYFPFDGWELGQTVVPALLDRLRARVTDDLRFSRAIVYPRVSVRVELVVTAYGQDEAMTVPVVWAPAAGQPGSTPAAVAAQHADDLVFVIRETLQEFDAAGNPETPPNAVREQMGLDVPMKQRVKTGRGFQIVDRVR